MAFDNNLIVCFLRQKRWAAKWTGRQTQRRRNYCRPWKGKIFDHVSDVKHLLSCHTKVDYQGPLERILGEISKGYSLKTKTKTKKNPVQSSGIVSKIWELLAESARWDSTFFPDQCKLQYHDAHWCGWSTSIKSEMLHGIADQGESEAVSPLGGTGDMLLKKILKNWSVLDVFPLFRADMWPFKSSYLDPRLVY